MDKGKGNEGNWKGKGLPLFNYVIYVLGRKTDYLCLSEREKTKIFIEIRPQPNQKNHFV